MNIDGRIAERVHRHMMVQDIPVLSVHDSFIVDYTHVGALKRAMALASSEIVGRAIPVSQSAQGLDEFRQNSDKDVVSDFITWTQMPRCEGYLNRLREWEEEVGGVVYPY